MNPLPIVTWKTWDMEFANQGVAVEGRTRFHDEDDDSSDDEGGTWHERQDRQFKKRIAVRKYVKYFDKSVLNYNTEGIVGPGVFLSLLTSASVFGEWKLLRDVMLVMVISMSILGTMTLTGTDIPSADASKFKDLLIDFRSLCTFLLGFFISTCISRWWAVRNDCIGKLWGAIDDLSLLMGTYFPTDSAADQEVRELVLRWSVLSHELVYKQARAEDDLSDLVHQGLLLEHELIILGPLVSKPQVIWAWMCSYFAHLAFGDPAKGGTRLPYPVTVLPQLHEICRSARGGIGAAFAYTDTQVPFRYVHFLCLLVWVHNLFQALNSAIVIRELFAGTGGETEGWVFLRAGVETTFLIWFPLVYFSLLHLGAGMLNPLRCQQHVDFPRGAFTYYMQAETAAFCQANVLPHGPPYGRPPSWAGSQAKQVYSGLS